MVGVAQLVEPRIVDPVVAGSIPSSTPIGTVGIHSPSDHAGIRRNDGFTDPQDDRCRSLDRVRGRLADRVKSTAKKVSLPGFRRGRVPLVEVERRFGASLRNEVASELIQSSLEDAVRQEDISLIGTPTVELVNVESGADLEFTATFEVLPEVDLVDLSTLRVRKPVAEISEADIDEMVESLRKQRTEWNPVERPVAVDDRVVVDYSVKVDGEVLGEPQVDFTFVVGSSQVVAELDTAVVGMSVDDTRAFPITIQRDSNESSGESEGIGEVTLKLVEAPSLPELDGAFFEAFGVADEAAPTDLATGGEGGIEGDEATSEADISPDGAGGGLQKFRANVRNGCRRNSRWRRETRPGARLWPRSPVRTASNCRACSWKRNSNRSASAWLS